MVTIGKRSCRTGPHTHLYHRNTDWHTDRQLPRDCHVLTFPTHAHRHTRTHPRTSSFVARCVYNNHMCCYMSLPMSLDFENPSQYIVVPHDFIPQFWPSNSTDVRVTAAGPAQWSSFPCCWVSLNTCSVRAVVIECLSSDSVIMQTNWFLMENIFLSLVIIFVWIRRGRDICT